MIRPLDLQTLYMQMDKVGKEQSLSREHVIHQQQLEAQKLAKLHDQQGHAVAQVQDNDETSGEESSKVRPDEKENPAPEGKRQKKKKSPEEESQPENQKNEWQDPELGRHIDLSG